MYQFIWPIVFILLPLPLVLRWLLPSSEQKYPQSGALKVPFFYRLKKLQPTGQNTTRWAHPVFWTITWICFIMAAARPVWIGEPIPLEQESRNIVLTLDVSGSMQEQDFALNGQQMTRLEIVKHLAKDFFEERQGDNLGLVIFGSEAYTYAPLSPDTQTLKSLLDEIGIGIAGQQTALGDALALAAQNASAVPENARIVILMSDGYANAGVIQMDEAIKIAQKAGVKVYTIGIGSEAKDFLGFVQINPSSDLDEATLKKVATETGGQYFRATSTEKLQEIYNIIDQLETTESDPLSIRPRKEMAYLFILIGLAFWLLALAMGGRK
ncbi:MAG: VWA domain-containing protein [Alphaproteobacteria bacterium]|nr:VWA domain-containing protein [Alphaproteobacteria bacterium]